MAVPFYIHMVMVTLILDMVTLILDMVILTIIETGSSKNLGVPSWIFRESCPN